MERKTNELLSWDQVVHTILTMDGIASHGQEKTLKALSGAAEQYCNVRLSPAQRMLLETACPSVGMIVDQYDCNTRAELALLIHAHTNPLFCMFGQRPIVEFGLELEDVGIRATQANWETVHELLAHTVNAIVPHQVGDLDIMSIDLVDEQFCIRGLFPQYAYMAAFTEDGELAPADTMLN